MTKRVLIADDQDSIRGVLRTLIAGMGGEVVGEAENGVEAVRKYGELKPDLVLLDINMPQMNGVDALKAIKADHPDAVAAMLTSQNTVDVVRSCIAQGASNFILKTDPQSIQDQLEQLIR